MLIGVCIGFNLGTQHGKKVGKAEGYRQGVTEGICLGKKEGAIETRLRIASDFAEMGMTNPVRMVSDHPGIVPMPVPYFRANEFLTRTQYLELYGDEKKKINFGGF